MVMLGQDLLFAIVSEDELNQLLRASGNHMASPWNPREVSIPVGGEVGVVLNWDGQSARPISIISNEDSLRRLYGRFSHVRQDFSPLSVWTHVLTPRFVEGLEGTVRTPRLSRSEAAWAGLTVAEAQFLSGTSMASLRLNACLATQTFAVARTIALWPHIPIETAAQTYDQARRTLRNSGSQRGEEVFRVIWEVLSDVGEGARRNPDRLRKLLVETAERLAEKHGEERVSAAAWIFDPIAGHTSINLKTIENSPPEHRLRMFDTLISNLNELDTKSFEYAATAMLAGFITTIAAGGAPSLSLAEGQMHRHPMVLGWAYSLGSIGEEVVWTSSFEGLGRLVVRELSRPFSLAEPPTCDFDVNELKVLFDPELKDPLVHLKIKQARSVQVALFPGVNVVFPIAEVSRNEKEERRGSSSRTPTALPQDLMTALVDALLPQLEKRLSNPGRATSNVAKSKPSTKRAKAEKAAERTLPFGRK